MKEFLVYTLLRLGLFAGASGIVYGIWALFAEPVPLLWVLVIGFAVSGVVAYKLLDPQREAFARRVQSRATQASSRLEAHRSKEDPPAE